MQKTALALGMFDGMHIGHKKIIETAVLLAKSGGLTPAVCTFTGHPQELFGVRVARLTTNDERLEIIKKLGAERIEQLEFTKAIAALSPENFVEMLKERFDPAVITAGFNYTFGKGKKGDAEALKRIAFRHGISVAIVPPVEFGKKPVSSTRIRELIEKGDVATAQLLLGRPYTLCGEVVENNHIGRTIGFPTANFYPDPSRSIPADGVYMSMALVNGEVRPSITNIGANPTVGGTKRTVETHIIDFDGDIYGTELKVFFVKRIRPVNKFSGLDELKAQIQRDTTSVREYFGC